MKSREKLIGAIAILILSIVFLIVGYFSTKNKEKDFEQVFIDSYETENNSLNTNEMAEFNEESTKTRKTIIVDIKGAVKNPREYELNEGSRVRDLIEAAGGLLKDADEEKIKFSKVLKDEDFIKIYKIGEVDEDSEAFFDEEEGDNDDSSKKININKASLTELQSLPGIGEVKAQSIIDYRESSGGFKSIEDLTNITGIGAKTLDKLRDLIDID